MKILKSSWIPSPQYTESQFLKIFILPEFDRKKRTEVKPVSLTLQNPSIFKKRLWNSESGNLVFLIKLFLIGITKLPCSKTSSPAKWKSEDNCHCSLDNKHTHTHLKKLLNGTQIKTWTHLKRVIEKGRSKKRSNKSDRLLLEKKNNRHPVKTFTRAIYFKANKVNCRFRLLISLLSQFFCPLRGWAVSYLFKITNNTLLSLNMYIQAPLLNDLRPNRILFWHRGLAWKQVPTLSDIELKGDHLQTWFDKMLCELAKDHIAVSCLIWGTLFSPPFYLLWIFAQRDLWNLHLSDMTLLCQEGNKVSFVLDDLAIFV